MLWKNLLAMVRILAAAVLAAGAVWMVAHEAVAHENHAPLPTKGVTVAGDTIMLSDKAREAIGLTTAKIEFGDIHRTVTVNARVELPWHAQAMITSLVPGKVDRVLVRPGETVVPGQELARLISPELERLQLELLQAKVQVELARKLVDQQTALDQQGIARAAANHRVGRTNDRFLGDLDGDPHPAKHARPEPSRGIVNSDHHRLGPCLWSHLHPQVVDLAAEHLARQRGKACFDLLAFRQQANVGLQHVANDPQRRGINHVVKVFCGTHHLPDANVGVRDDAANRADNRNVGESFALLFDSLQDFLLDADCDELLPEDLLGCRRLCQPRLGLQERLAGDDSLLVQRLPGKYESRQVKLGLTDKGLIEVLDGVFPGDQVVVVGNSLLAALLGNEHKARVDGAEPEQAPETHQGVVAVAHGSIELPTDQQSLATPQIEGRVRRILVQPSQHVSQGDVLVEIDSLPLRSVQLDLLQTITGARLLEQSLKRLEELHDQGLVAKRQRWELQSEHQTLLAKTETLERQLAYFGLDQDAVEKLKQADLSQTGSLAELVQTLPVRAPATGWIVGFHVVPGQVVHPEQPLFEIHNLSTVWVKGFVYERDADRVQLGQPAHVRFAAYPDLEVNGKVVRISPLMHDRMRVLPVWVEVSNPDHLLKTGMLARMTIMDRSTGENDSDNVARLQSIEPTR